MEELHGSLNARFEGAGRGEAAGNGRRRERGGRGCPGWRLGTALTAGSHLSVTGAKEKGEGRCWAGGGGDLGQLGPLRARGKEKEKGLPAWVGRRPKVKGERDREREKGFSFFF
jgi:hypothetical protein